MSSDTQSLSERAHSFLQKGRIDLAAVFFAAAVHDPEANEGQQWAAAQNSTLYAEKVAERLWGVTAPEFLCDPRHEAVCDAVEKAATGGRRVLLLGSALGAYALAANRGGASKIVCQEANGFIEYVVGSVLRVNELLQSVEITTKSVADLVSSNSEKFDVVVAVERCWGSALTSVGLQDLFAALPGLAADAQVIPQSVSIHAQAFESETLHSSNWLDAETFRNATGLDYFLYNGAARRSRMAFRLPYSKCGRPLSEPEEWTLVDVSRVCSEGASSSSATPTGSLTLSMRGDGRLDGVLTWTSMRLGTGGESDRLSWEPGGTLAMAWQYCHYLPHLTRMEEREELAVSLHLQEDGVWLLGTRAPGDLIELSPYHTSMLSSDSQRTRAYREGIALAVRSLQAGRDCQDGLVSVLDVGAGTGLLSFFAASAGADVVGVERAGTTAALAAKLAEANKGNVAPGTVHIKHTRSVDLPKEVAQRPQLVVSEIFGTDPLSESILPVLKDISDRFDCENDPIAFLPCRCRLWGALAKVPVAWQSRTEEACSCGIDVGELMEPFESGQFLVDLRDEFCDVELLTEPAILATHDLVPPIRVAGTNSVSLPLLPEPQPLFRLLSVPRTPEVCSPSLADELCVVMWFDADCTLQPSDDPTTRLSTSPTADMGAHWTQFARVLKDSDLDDGVREAVVSREAGVVRIHTSWRLDRTQFRVELVSQGRDCEASA